jgi:hypothetical protein
MVSKQREKKEYKDDFFLGRFRIKEKIIDMLLR